MRDHVDGRTAVANRKHVVENPASAGSEGSSGRFARGSSHQKCTASPQRGPTAVRSRSIIVLMSAVSGFAAACGGPGCCAAAAATTLEINSAAPNASESSSSLLALLSFRKVAVDRFNEHVGRPRSRRRAVSGIVVGRRPRGLHLVERRTFLEHRLQCDRGRSTTMSRYSTTSCSSQRYPCPGPRRAALALVLRTRFGRGCRSSALISPCTRAAVLQVDHRILRRRKHVARNDDVGAAEIERCCRHRSPHAAPETSRSRRCCGTFAGALRDRCRWERPQAAPSTPPSGSARSGAP